MANLPNHLSRLLKIANKSKSTKPLAYRSLFIVAIIIAFSYCSVSAQSLTNDSDGDGLTDAYELKIGSESYLSDTDGDTIKDGDEIGENKDKPKDSDNDGVIDVLDYDDDNDGLPSYLESKKDTDKDGLLDYLDVDSDNDDVADGEESGFLNQDKNQDGIDDAFDVNREGAVDKNGDGIDDNVKLPDHNNDGKPDYLDSKFQHVKQTLVNKSKNNKIKILAKEKRFFPQIDNENPKTIVVARTKTIVRNKTPTADNMIINRHTDSDNDGLSNALEKILGTNHLSRDSDGDNVSDAIEIGLDVNSPQDSDHDGIIDALDNDDDNDGILTKLEDLNKDSTAINDDTDDDGVPNYLDANDDGDDLLTKAEGFVLDTDGDGILDYLDKNNGTKNQSNASNTMKITNKELAITEPEIVVLFDGDAAALSAEEDIVNEGLATDLQSDFVQEQLLSSLDGMLNENGLSQESIDTTTNKSADGSKEIKTSKSSNNRASHWNLF
ncbi:MAG: hypothetical protein ACI88H_001670 [Cocleimonas sp.]